MLSTCPHCKNHIFEIQEVSPSGSNFKLYFVQCTHCGAPLGTQEFFNTSALIKDLELKVDNLQQTQSQMSNTLSYMAQKLKV